MLNSHTHCQVAPADTQAKTWQRMCLFQPPQLTDNQDEKKNTVDSPEIRPVGVREKSLT